MEHIETLISELRIRISELPESPEHIMATHHLAEMESYLEAWRVRNPVKDKLDIYTGRNITIPKFPLDAIVMTGETESIFSGTSQRLLTWIGEHTMGPAETRYQVRLIESGKIVSIADYFMELQDRITRSLHQQEKEK